MDSVLRRRIAASLAVLLCFCLLIGLGLWQLQRMQWKESLLADLEKGAANQAVAWTDSDQSPEFTHVLLSGGRLQAMPNLALYGRTFDGTAGIHVIALYTPSVGRPVIVDRGFVPTPIDTAKTEASAAGTIDGVIRSPSDKAWFENANEPAKNQWYWMDLPAMATALGVGEVAPIYVEALKPTAANGPLPTGGRLASNIPNNHLQYAITWFSLAIVLLVMYSVWIVRLAGKRQP